ncbi:MAG: 16S rRNA (cytosine(1402)-N(4))-methyltransferase RsmH [Tissierellia bacterium]|nr:16S rRNA (cytosine(1402)-N(4))-methyltransferase RsmH [Tissierellia bacterium]
MEFKHTSVLLEEVLEGLNIKTNGVYLDGTIGGAGHSQEILKRIPQGFLIGLDQDEVALKASKDRLRGIGENFRLFHLNYFHFKEALDILDIEKLDGILLDLGVSSYQLDEESRGFSYRFDAPLDMRMNQNNSLTAKEVVNTYSEDSLKKIFYKYGEERWSARVAEFIIKERKFQKIDTTFDLVEVIKKAIPKGARRHGGHPAKRIFQALRIEVNNELDVLENSIDSMIDALKPGGRLAIITFQSLEDRIVKDAFRYAFSDCICPETSPICTCDKVREVNIITRKPILPSKKELKNNSRSASAKLRIVEKLSMD